MSLLYFAKPFVELGICKEYCMARKTTGITSPRSKKTGMPEESAAMQPSAPPAAPERQMTAVIAGNGGKKSNANLDEEIRRRAYELYLERNGAAGDPNRDWFIAEREVRARHATAGHSA
jgi:Protein of unknown function (DUF2934)